MGISMLPDGYHTERDADVLTLLRDDGSVVARFSARGVQLQEVKREATEDALYKSHERLRRAHTRHARKRLLPRHD